MCDSGSILRMYSCVLNAHKNKYGVNEADIRTAIQNMKEVYKPNPGSLSDAVVYVADYNDAGHRCAYLHKYAPFHTALVADMLQTALQQNPRVFSDLIYASGNINICSLGGGPGCDIFGVLSVLNAAFGLFQVSATVIDCMEKWKDMFYELVKELRYGDYGDFGESVDEQYFEWSYLQHNLLSKMTNQVNQAIARADLVTMIKFVSASSCKDTSTMIQKIFASMNHGALVLYIDNAGGGFHKLVTKKAEKFNFESVFYENHEHFVKPALRARKFGYTPCFESKVSVHIWKKTFSKDTSCSSPRFSYNDQNFPPLSTIVISPPKKYENQLHNEVFTFNNRISVPSISAELLSKFIDADHTYLSQDTSYAKNNTNTLFDSSKLNAKSFDNSLEESSESERKICPRTISPGESGNDRNTIDTNFVSYHLHTKHEISPATVSNVKNIKTSQYSQDKSIDSQKKPYPKETPTKESVPYGITRNAINTDFVENQLHTKHETNPASISNVKNIKTFEYLQDKSSEIRTTTNRREIAAQVFIPSRNTSVPFSWKDCIRDIFCQELICLIIAEFSSLFQEDQISTFNLSPSLGERFIFYLFETL
ncbi:unnamed protein product [Larinioides sclopetarius]|uniref:Uncharacterized protein n=1 Tax=Larinioides sclopetarius TaxID=280406 RepID=A0AAV1ZVX4_9ARAC